MQALAIVALIFAILAKGVIGAVAVMNLMKGKGFPYIIIIAALGAMVLGDIMYMIPTTATGIIGCIFWLLGWPGFAAGTLLAHLKPSGPIPLTVADGGAPVKP